MNSFFNICYISIVNIRIDFILLYSFNCRPPFLSDLNAK